MEDQQVIPSLARVKVKAAQERVEHSLVDHGDQAVVQTAHLMAPLPVVHWLPYGGEMGMPVLTADLRLVRFVRATWNPAEVTCEDCQELIRAYEAGEAAWAKGKPVAIARRLRERQAASTEKLARRRPVAHIGPKLPGAVVAPGAVSVDA
jgi:hypothetical protein